MLKPQFGSWRWRIHRWNEHPNPFRGRADLALQWLRQFEGEAYLIDELRDLMGPGALSRASDSRQILEETAHRLAAGELQLCGEYCGAYHSRSDFRFEETGGDEIETTPSPAPAPAVSSAATADAQSETPQEQAEAAVSPATDAETTAQAMKDAAEEGVPFCEECAKAAAVPVPAPVMRTSDSTFPDDVDTMAQADSLQKAALHGAPFCEECEKARRARESQQPSPAAV